MEGRPSDVSEEGEYTVAVEFENVALEPGPPPALPPPPPPVKRGLFDKMRLTISRGPSSAESPSESHNLLGDHRSAGASHSYMDQLAARTQSAPSASAFGRAHNYNVTQSPAYIDFELQPSSKPSQRVAAASRSVFSMTATAATRLSAASTAQGEGMPVPDTPGGGPPQQQQLPLEQGPDQRRSGFPQFPFSGKLQDILLQCIFLLFIIAAVATVLAVFFAALHFTSRHSNDKGRCYTSIAAAVAVADGRRLVVTGLANPAVTVCRGEEEDQGPWVSEDAIQTLLVAHSELYSEARLSLTFDLPDGSARWAVQLQLGKLEGNATALEMEVDSWYVPPRTAYPGADKFVAVYGPGAPLPNPLLVFGLDVGDNTLVVSAESDRRRRRRH